MSPENLRRYMFREIACESILCLSCQLILLVFSCPIKDLTVLVEYLNFLSESINLQATYHKTTT